MRIIYLDASYTTVWTKNLAQKYAIRSDVRACSHVAIQPEWRVEYIFQEDRRRADCINVGIDGTVLRSCMKMRPSFWARESER